MHLTILSRSSGIYTTRRLVDAARLSRHKVRVLNPLGCEMYLDGKSARLFYRRKRLAETEACIPRIAESMQNYGLAVVNQFAQQGVPILNSATAIAQSRNKIRCLQLLSSHGIAVPPTVMGNDAADLKELVSLVGGVPVLLKLIQSGGRSGVMVCETLQSMEAALEALLGMGHNLIVQQYVRDTKGQDIRAFVVGGHVVAAVRRTPRVGRLGRTLGAGAKFEATRLGKDYEQIAVSTAGLVGLEVAAVDMLDLNEGPKVFEVNSSPGIKEVEEATGTDVARAVIARAAELATIYRTRGLSTPAAPAPGSSGQPAEEPAQKGETRSERGEMEPKGARPRRAGERKKDASP